MSEWRNRMTRFMLDRLPDPVRHVQENRIQRRSGRPHEPDFAVFRWFAGSRPFLVVDAGAHRGHSAISIFCQCDNAEVAAFEPNPRLRPALEWVRRRYPDRFRYHLVGLGERQRRDRLQVPRVGKRDLSTSASARASEFDKPYVRDRLKSEAATRGAIDFTAIEIEIEPLDAFHLDPQLVKIDVEGMEADVVRGALKTLQTSLPLLLVEINNHAEFFELLRPLGYEFFRYAPEIARLVPFPKEDDTQLPSNGLAVHPNSRLAPRLRFGAA